MSTRDTPRKTFSAPQSYWDALDEIVIDGLAKNTSDALRFVIDEYRRGKQQQALAESAGRLDEDDWLNLAGVDGDDAGDQSSAPPWSQLVTDQQD